MDLKNLMIDILSNIDGLDAEIEDISRLISMYDENITADLEPLRKGETWGGKYLVDRWPLYQSMLSVILLRLSDILEDMQSNIQKGYYALGTNTPTQA